MRSEAKEKMSDYRMETDINNMSAEVKDEEKKQIQERLTEIYRQVGEIFYKENHDNPYLKENYADFFSEIKEKLMQLDKLSKEELAVNGLKRCPYCHTDIPIQSKFCNMCGYKLIEEPEPKRESSPRHIIKRCAWCGILLEEDAMFCGNCGHPVNEVG